MTRRALVIVTVLGLALSAVAQQRERTDRPNPFLPADAVVHADLAYVDDGHKKQTLDIYLPADAATTGPLPVIVWVHGGGWKGGSKDRPNRATPFVGKGYAVASINYRLTDAATFPAQIHDCKAAIRWLRANAKTYHLDPQRIGVWGSSAGGHLVALLGTSGDVAELEGELGNADQSSRVQAVVDWFGPTDLTQMGPRHANPNSPPSLLLGGPAKDNPDKAAAASPITYVTKDDPPFLIMHGTADPTVPFSQSVLLHDALKASGVDTTLVPVNGAGHGGKQFHGPENAELMKQIEAFFEKHLKGAPTDAAQQ